MSADVSGTIGSVTIPGMDVDPALRHRVADATVTVLGRDGDRSRTPTSR